MVRCQAVSLIPPKAREPALRKRTMPRQVRAGSRPQVMSRRHPMVKISRSTFTPRTPSPVLFSSSASMRTPTLSPTPGRKSRQHGKSSTRTAPRRTAPRKTPVDHHLQRKSHQPMRHSEMELGKKRGCLTHALMLNITTKLPTMLQAGQHGIPWSATFKNMTRLNPTTPIPWGYLWITWQSARSFDCIWLNLYDLCHFYALGMTGDPPDFPALWEPVMCSQVRDLLKLAWSISHPYMILVHSANCMTAMSMLQELHMAACLRHLQVDLHDKSVKMSFCPFCMYMGTNNLSYLNHIIVVHYNASYGCEKCWNQAFVSSSALHNHKVCLGFNEKSTAGSNSKPSRGSGGNASQGGRSIRATSKKKDSKAPTADSQGSSAFQMTPCCSRRDRSPCSKPHKDSKSIKDSSGDKKKKKGHASPARKGSSHKSHKHSGQH